MLRKLCLALAATTMTLACAPAMAQTAAAEEARTTYRIVFLKLKPGSDERWSELTTKYFGPASDEAKVKRSTIHWLVAGPWDLMLVQELPRGLATLDMHETPERKAMRAAMAKIAGGEEAAKKIYAENDSLIAERSVVFSHTHP